MSTLGNWSTIESIGVTGGAINARVTNLECSSWSPCVTKEIISSVALNNSAATSLVVDVSDMTDKRSLVVVVSSAGGTYKVEGRMSLDAGGNYLGPLIEFGNSKTASWVIDLETNSPTLPYGPYMQVVITETASSAITLACYLTGQRLQ